MATLLMVTHSLGLGGAPISLMELGAGFKNQGWSVVVASEKDGPLREKYEERGFVVVILPRRGVLESGLVLDYIRLIKQHNVDIVHLNTFTSYYKYPGIAGRITNVDVVWWIREDVQARRCRKLMFWLRRLPKQIVTVSKEQARHLIENGIGQVPITTIYNGISLSGSGSKASDPMLQAYKKPLIGFVGTLEGRKGLHDLVTAAQQLKNRGVSFSVVVVGRALEDNNSYINTIHTQLESSGLQEDFHFLGAVPNGARLFLEFDLFVLPTYWEGCARVLLEAMAATCPIVTTDAGGNPEMIRDGIDGVVVKTGDADALAMGIETLILDQTLADSYAQSAYSVVQERFPMEKHIDTVRELYKKISPVTQNRDYNNNEDTSDSRDLKM